MGRVVSTLLALSVLGVGQPSGAFELQSAAFSPGGDIPVKHTCDGADVSPPLRWTDPPAGTRGFALVSDDPDAPGGVWVHWVLYEIPPALRELPEAVPARDAVAGIGRQGMNDFRKIGYGGPCPPRGPAHRYLFSLYALDAEPASPPRTTRADLLKAIQGHILGRAELMGRYRRR